MILLFCQPLTPEVLWNNYKLSLCENLLYQNNQLTNAKCTDLNNSIESETLEQLQNYLLLNGKSLKNFPNMPLPKEEVTGINNEDLNQLIWEERSYNIAQLQNEIL